jgi:ABC-2 type transport system permease protein
MRTLRFVLKKEFLQIFRNRSMLPIIFVMPIVQLLILSNAASFDLRSVEYYLVDKDQTVLSRNLTQRLTHNPYFRLTGISFSESSGENALRTNSASVIIHIPHDFEKNLLRNEPAPLQLLVNAEDGNAAGLIQTYIAAIVSEFQSDWLEENGFSAQRPVRLDESYWYNPRLDYPTYMVPGILVALVSMIGLFLSGMNIVREREIGTIEQLNVTPIRKTQFVIGKLVPFWVIAMFEMTFGIVIGKLAFDLPIVGSVWTVLALTAIYMILILGIGLFISTVTETQQQAMFIAWFIMVVFLLLGGLFTPIESMPDWAQAITKANPVAYMVDAMRRILLKGAGFADLTRTFAFLSVGAVVVISMATMRYRKSTS